jgi:hypothetical protein
LPALLGGPVEVAVEASNEGHQIRVGSVGAVEIKQICENPRGRGNRRRDAKTMQAVFAKLGFPTVRAFRLFIGTKAKPKASGFVIGILRGAR